VLRRILNLLGWAGVALVLAALALLYLRPDQTALRQGLAIAGLVCVLLYMFSDWREIVAAFSRRQARYGALSVASVLIVLGLLVGINYVAARQNTRWDLTASKQFSLSDQTRKVLQDLKQPVKLTVFDRDTTFSRFRDRLGGYEYASPNVKIVYVDIDREPARARAQQVQQYGTLVVDYEGRVERTTSDEEQDITNAIVKAVQGQQKRVYFLQGHGEKDTGSSDQRTGFNAVAGALARDNFTVEKLVLAQVQDVPADATVLVAAGPTADYLPQEIEMLRRYLRKGGKLLVMIDPPERADSPALTNLQAFVREWGIEVGNDVVLDPVGQALGMGADAPVAATYPAHPITDRFAVLTAFPLTQSVTAVSGGVDGRFAQAIVETSPQSFSKRDLSVLRSGGQVAFDESRGDKPGPISIAAAMSTTAPDAAVEPAPAGEEAKKDQPPPAPKPETRVVVFGDSDFATNSVLGLGGNRDLFLNTVNWLAQQENLIAIRAREAEDRRITPSPNQSRWALAQSLLVLPGIVLLLGFYTWWRRR
jgi:ABC-type uncharacterized transport system involved in gliding motility auxiliary subunit